MKMLFVHDNKFWRHNGLVYSYGHFAYELLWKRYLNEFDEIRVGGRFQDAVSADEIKSMSLSNGENVSFFALPNLMSLKGLFKIAQAKRTIEEEMRQADIAIVRLPSNLGYAACSVAQKLRKPYLVEVVGCTWDDLWNYGSVMGKIAAVPSWLLEKNYVKKAPNAIYVSRHFLQKRYPNNGKNISCPDTNIHETDESVLKTRLEHIRTMASRPEIRIGLIASLDVGYKGHDLAIKALALLKDKYPRLKMCFLGNGRTLRWEQLANKFGVLDKIEFSGALPGGKPVLDWIDNLDVFIMPSLQETLGRALVEAMSRACPAIGGAGTAVQEQLADDCIHRRKDHTELAELLDRMVSSQRYMELCATENFYRSRKYCEEFLGERRRDFWRSVIDGLVH